MAEGMIDPRIHLANFYARISEMLTKWREGNLGKVGITEVFLAALGVDGKGGFQCELGFGDGTTKSFQSYTLCLAVEDAYIWALSAYEVGK